MLVKNKATDYARGMFITYPYYTLSINYAVAYINL